MPAIFFLELHKPVGRLIAEGISMSMPLMTLLFKAGPIETVREILSSHELTEELLTHLENG